MNYTFKKGEYDKFYVMYIYHPKTKLREKMLTYNGWKAKIPNAWTNLKTIRKTSISEKKWMTETNRQFADEILMINKYMEI